MTDNQIKFRELYIKNILDGSGEMGKELLALFDVVLAEFNGDPETMSAFIDSIIDQHTEPSELEQLKQENEKLKNRVEEMATQQALTDGAIMDLASMVLTK